MKDETCKIVQLEEWQISLIIRLLKEKRDELDIAIKNPDGLEDETIRDLWIDHRNINDTLRELMFYAVFENDTRKT